MKLTKGKIIAGERLLMQGENGRPVYSFTVQSDDNPVITLGQEVTTFAFEGVDDIRLRNLLEYLEDRPALMEESEVEEGVVALKYLLGNK